MDCPPEPQLQFLYDLTGVGPQTHLMLPISLGPDPCRELPEVYERVRLHVDGKTDDMRFLFYDDEGPAASLATRLRTRPCVVLFHPDTIGIEFAAAVRTELGLPEEAGPTSPMDVAWPLPDPWSDGSLSDPLFSDDLSGPLSSSSDMEMDDIIDTCTWYPLPRRTPDDHVDAPPSHLWTPWADSHVLTF
jgi:hypothetical protein